MMAIILAGGLGTRLQTLYADRPKALVPVAGRPFIEWQLDWLQQHNIQRIHFSTGYRADQIQTYLDAHRRPGLDVSVFAEPEARGTGGAIAANRSFVQGDHFLVLNGDSLTPKLDLTSMMEDHVGRSETHTLAVTWIDDASRFGTVRLDEHQTILAFEEKQHAASGYVNCGIYALHSGILDEIPDSGSVSIEQDVFPKLVQAGLLKAYPCPQPLLDMGTPHGLEEMNLFLL